MNNYGATKQGVGGECQFTMSDSGGFTHIYRKFSPYTMMMMLFHQIEFKSPEKD